MKQRITIFLYFSLILIYLSLSVGCSASNVNIRIDCDEPTVPISPVLYGIFFEDINFAADGGLYAEMVQNRSFEYYPIGGNRLSEQYDPLYAWEKVERSGARVSIALDRLVPLNRNNPFYLTVRVSEAGNGGGVKNTGFDGMTLDAGESYNVSFYARLSGRDSASITAALELEDGTVCGSARFDGIGNDWQKFEGVITPDKTSDNAHLVLTTADRCTLHLDMVSLFPQKTFKGRKNGMRADLAQALANLEPKFFRFPGGCIIHGSGLMNAYRWKDSVGDVARRRGNWNRWGYHQTYGLGYYEYFQLCEDIGATALPVLPVGVSCGFNEPYQCVPMDELQPWIDDAIDLIEFANGPADSEWGKVRADMGHPKPFGLKYICLGNEEHDRPEFHKRFPHFVRAVRKTYPDIKIIGTSGLGAEIPLYPLMDKLNVYSSDEHYYMSPDWFIANQNRFDEFDRSKPKIFVGEYASHSQGNTLYDAVAEAAFLTGVERNGDIVDMTCYAPLFAHVDHTQWGAADMIWFDKRTLAKTPNYYVQQLFSRNAGDVYLANEVTQPADTVLPTIVGGVGIAAWDTAIEVQKADVNGETLTFNNWKAGPGSFRINDGHYLQTDTSIQPAISFAPEQYNGQTVTYTVRAKRTAGREGFILVFGAKDTDNYYWWNIGGWGNTQHAIEQAAGGQKTVLVQTRGAIRNDQWYTARVELSPGRIRCYLNDELIHDYELAAPSISVASTLDKKTGEVIVKLVNPTDEDVNATIQLDGVRKVNPEAKLMRLAGERGAKNTVQKPDTVRTETTTLTVGKQFNYTLPAMSVQFIRVKAK